MATAEPPYGTPLLRYVEWYEGLPIELRTHLAPHLFGSEASDGDEIVPRVRAIAIGARLAGASGDPASEAGLVVRLAMRTDAILADVAIREQWTSESALASLPRDDVRRAQMVARTLEWMRAAEQWGLLRVGALAARRIERWLAKRDHARRAS